MQISSSAFRDGDNIPALYTCEGRNDSPPLSWSGAPQGTGYLALIMDDPDAPSGIFTHWVIYNMSVATSGLPQAAALPSGSTTARSGPGH